MEAILKFAIVGDFVPGGILSNVREYNPLIKVIKEFEDCEFVWANLECSFPFGNTARKDFRSSIVPGDFQLFKKLASSYRWIFSMANNHALDYGLDSLIELKKFTTIQKIPLFGVGESQKQARNPHIVKFKGLRMGFLAYTSDDKWVGDHLKEADGEFIAILNEKSKEEVNKLSKEVDLLFVGLHFGKEWIDLPVPKDINIARSLIDAGASAILGHHPHILQGYEVYNNKPIFYSLGNFIFPEMKVPQKLEWSKKERTGIIVKFSIYEDKTFIYELIPVFLEKNSETIHVLPEKERKFLFKYLNKISKEIQLEPKKYEKKFQNKFRKVSLFRLGRGLVRNIKKPKVKHLKMFMKILKESIVGLKLKKVA